jgi:DNA-binding protein WhiA
MSFTGEVKNEVSKLENIELENMTELSAILHNIGSFDKESIKITSENASVARRIFILMKEIYQVTCKTTVRKGYNFNKNYIYILETTSKTNQIIETLSLNTKNDIPKEYIYADESLKRAYLRGLFLSCGSINDPKKSRYHLEFLVDSLEYANFISHMLNDFDLNSKVLKRENKYMVYMKEAEKIGDFLRIIQAMNSLFYYEDIRIYRDHKNMTNRLNNCEQANVDKMIETATKQIKDIELLEKVGAQDLLDEKVREVLLYRKKYPEVSLTELSEIISVETGTKITKSGLYHRMNKIKELANKIREKEDKLKKL